MAEVKSQAEQMGRQGLPGGTAKKPGAAPVIVNPSPADLGGLAGKPKKWWDAKLGKWHFPEDADYSPPPNPVTALPKKPKMAEGGVVPPVPGGMDITAGEGGEPEVVIPMSKLIRIVGEETASKIAAAASGGGLGPGMGVMGAAADRMRGMGAPPPEEMPEDELEG